MILIIFINCIINQLFISHCTGLYVPFPTIFANKRKDRLSDGIKLPPPSFPPVLPLAESSALFKRCLTTAARLALPMPPRLRANKI
ncbi:hypothetical protein ACR30T_05475 [Neisseria gonorrhoeae]